ncbi:MAG: glycosyltransferase [Clostridia bacterium]|nr:glycosyltransferase [Clostridia bacterium]
MNVQTDAIVGNQGSTTSTQEFYMDGNRILHINTTDRGVGKNRNLVLRHARGEICVFADDDMRFVDGYPQIVEEAARLRPDADILIFNLIEKHPVRYVIKKITRITWRNYARYGAARLAVYPEKIAAAGISFTSMFGGGCKYGSGEDTIFLKECLDKGLKLYAFPFALAEIDQDAESTWFCGYNKKFFFDKGAFYCAVAPKLKWIYSIRYLLKYRYKYAKECGVRAAFEYMSEGIRSFDREEFENERRAGRQQ